MGVKLDSPQNWTVRESRKRQITQGERSQNKNWIKSIEGLREFEARSSTFARPAIFTIVHFHLFRPDCSSLRMKTLSKPFLHGLF